MTWEAKYVGIRFDDENANGGAHCYGLVKAVFKNERRVALPEHSELTVDDMIAMAREVNSAIETGPWRGVPKGQEAEFDVAVFMGWVELPDGRMERQPTHMGVITPTRNVLHVEKKTSAVCVPLTHPSIRFRYRGAYRYVRDA
jgi:hypothetical protein